MANISLDAIELTKRDRGGMYNHIRDFISIFTQWWQRAGEWPLPAHYIKVNKILLTGLGGSAQGGAIAADLVAAESKAPIFLVRDYHLPAWVDSTTLVMAVSYSGTTEETVTTFVEGYEKGAKLLGLGTGGQIAQLARKYRVPYFAHDYESQPRAALPVHLAVLLNLLTRLGHGSITDREVAGLAAVEKKIQATWELAIPEGHNEAKRLARRLVGHVPVVIGDGVLSAVAHRVKSHLNENAKTPAYGEILPEMNHNSLVGTEGPRAAKEALQLILLDSHYTDPRNRTRMMLTERLYRDRRFSVDRYTFESDNPLQEVVSAIRFGDFVSFYLALLYEVDPTQTDIISEFKNKLSR